MRSLTDRYVHAVSRRVPEAMRPEVTADVTAMIADMLEARTASGPTAARPASEHPASENPTSTDAEVAVLEELGDPAVLAREYSDAPQHLIGPQYFPVYLWLLKWVLPVALVVSLVANGLAYTLRTPDAHLGGLLGTAIGESVPAVLVAFAAATILVAIIERATPMGAQVRGAHADDARAGAGPEDGTTSSGAGPTAGDGQASAAAGRADDRLRRAVDRRSRWTIDRLEDVAPSGSTVRADAIVSLVVIVLLASVPLLPTSVFYVGHLNDGEPFVNPELGAVWFIGYWALLAAITAGVVWRLRRGRLSTGPVALDMIADLAMAVFLTVALLTQDVLHPAIDTASAVPTAVWAIPLIWAITIWDQVSTVRAYRTHLAAEQRG